jgi:hypothetical protein
MEQSLDEKKTRRTGSKESVRQHKGSVRSLNIIKARDCDKRIFSWSVPFQYKKEVKA